jgi:putative membrane protein
MPRSWILVFLAALAWSAAGPYDRLTWFLDMLPAAAACLALAGTRGRYVATPLALWLLLALCLVILVGAHYSFPRVPAFDLVRTWTGGSRNNFDKLAHFLQGLAPAVVFRELLVRGEALADHRWLPVLVLALCLALSAAYELVEWLAALALGGRADAFLGVQGDPFDAQSDMALALAGGASALLLFSRVHDRQLARLE